MSNFKKKKRFCSKGEQSLLKELIPTENEDPWGAHKIKRNNFASPKIVSLHLEFSVYKSNRTLDVLALQQFLQGGKCLFK